MAARERIRSARALASLERLGIEPATLERERAALERFAAREAPAPEPLPPAPEPAPERPAVRPRRRAAGPLDFQRRLLPGFGALERAERERWRSLETGVAEPPLLDLAWFACDGRRTIGEIARLVWIECGRYAPRQIEEFFGLTERLGLSDGSGSEEESWSSSGRATDTR
jgi:hypothetical protein